mmetsp:Transcript_9357/g.10579  ORF Transcript_9357/g.10579 Transcript_9357/m.10579 type:complete len:154 (-) Transcript_9357:52-513(-)
MKAVSILEDATLLNLKQQILELVTVSIDAKIKIVKDERANIKTKNDNFDILKKDLIAKNNLNIKKLDVEQTPANLKDLIQGNQSLKNEFETKVPYSNFLANQNIFESNIDYVEDGKDLVKNSDTLNEYIKGEFLKEALKAVTNASKANTTALG